MDTNAVVWKRTTRGAALKRGTWLGSSLLVLVLGIAACGRVAAQLPGAPVPNPTPSTPGPQQTCVRVGHDSCYLLIVRR